jgi:methionyl-tRNA formyltransferase
MKLILMADGAVGLQVLKWILGNYPRDVAVVVVTAENEIGALANSHLIPVVVYETCLQVRAWLEENDLVPDLGLLAWWPYIIRKRLLDVPPSGFVNTHPSMLPYCRGKHYNFWTIVEEVPFGVSLHLVSADVDTGPVIAQKKIPYTWEDTGETLYRRAVSDMVKLVEETYPNLRRLQFVAVPQNMEHGSYHHSSEIDRACELDLDATYTARRLLNLLRARTFPGHPSCYFEDESGLFEVRVHIERVKK